MPDDPQFPMTLPHDGNGVPQRLTGEPEIVIQPVPETQPPARKIRKTPGLFRRFWSRWGHAILLVATIATTINVGYLNILSWVAFENGVGVEAFGDPYAHFFSLSFLLPTLGYTVALLGFLTAHEMGHYFACRRYGIDATLPYYLPNPIVFGTFGAVIRIKSPITDKKALFDIGAAGPLAGFAVAVPILIIGLMQSQIIPTSALSSNGGSDAGFWILGEPLLQKLLTMLLLPDAANASMVMSPLGMVGWFACLVTSVNLLPVSQLDGGHILYAVFGNKHYIVSLLVLIIMIVIAVVLGYYGWLIWGLLILVLGLRHPRLMNEQQPLGRGRLAVAVLTLIIFILCFVPVPIEVG